MDDITGTKERDRDSQSRNMEIKSWSSIIIPEQNAETLAETVLNLNEL